MGMTRARILEKVIHSVFNWGSWGLCSLLTESQQVASNVLTDTAVGSIFKGQLSSTLGKGFRFSALICAVLQ